MFQLLHPKLEHLPSYKDALERGWAHDNMRPIENAKEELQKIAEDPKAFIEGMYDPDAKGGPVILPDGSKVQRLPGYRVWMWDGEFCGSIGFRWQPGTAELPRHVLGHIGYSVVPWKRQRGYATKALSMLLPMARSQGLAYVELTTNLDNPASQKVITANGGILIDRFKKDAAYGGSESLRYRINLS